MFRLMSRAVVVVFAVVLMSGCFWNTNTGIDITGNVSHPELASPVKTYYFDWNIITKGNMHEKIKDDDDVYVALSYEDSLQFRLFLEDFKRYVEESTLVICYYRSELDEDFCEPFLTSEE